MRKIISAVILSTISMPSYSLQVWVCENPIENVLERMKNNMSVITELGKRGREEYEKCIKNPIDTAIIITMQTEDSSLYGAREPDVATQIDVSHCLTEYTERGSTNYYGGLWAWRFEGPTTTIWWTFSLENSGAFLLENPPELDWDIELQCRRIL